MTEIGALPLVRVFASAEEVASAGAAEIARLLALAIRERGVAHWATTGGSAAPPIYRLLRASPLRESVDWTRVQVWWGDDRFVPADDPLSNVLPFEQILRGSVPIPAANLHPIPMSAAIAAGTGAAGAASSYAGEISSIVPARPDGLPVFDLIWLGVGPDGHVLSVFPGSAVWDAEELCVPVPAPTHVEPHVERVTIHPRLLVAAREVLVVSTGASKAVNLGRAWSSDDVRALPVRATRLANAVWILDAAAASELPPPFR